MTREKVDEMISTGRAWDIFKPQTLSDTDKAAWFFFPGYFAHVGDPVNENEADVWIIVVIHKTSIDDQSQTTISAWVIDDSNTVKRFYNAHKTQDDVWCVREKR